MPYIPGENMAKATNRSGGGVPDTGYYKCTITHDGFLDDWTSKHQVTYPTGMQDSYLLNWSHNDNGELNPRLLKGARKMAADSNGKLSEDAAVARKIQGYADFVFGVGESCGYTQEQMGQGVSPQWFDGGRPCFTAWISGDDLGTQYGQTDKFITADQFAAFEAEGAKPTIPKRNDGHTERKAPPKTAAAAPPPPSTAAAPPPPGGSNHQTGHPSLPPPPASGSAPPRPPGAPGAVTG